MGNGVVRTGSVRPSQDGDANGSVQDFTDLRVWQDAMDLADRIYRKTWEFPRQETYGLASQLQRASVSISIPSNIAEGNGRGGLGDYQRFLSIARGSLAEVRCQLMLAERLGYVDAATSQRLIDHAKGIGRQLTALKKSLERQQ